MTVTYPLTGYPAQVLAYDGQKVTIRSLEPRDKEALLEFFRRIPEEDRAYLKEDVTSPEVIKEWTENIDFRRVLPLIALKDRRIIGDGTLHRRRPLARRHVGEVRVVVDPEFRNQGIGRMLLRRLLELAEFQKLEKVTFEIVADKEEPARRAAEILGFTPATVMKEHIRDLDGTPHDLVIMEMTHLSRILGIDMQKEMDALEGMF